MIVNKTDIGVLSFPESVSNSNGKTSGSKLGGMIALITGCISFIINTISILCVDSNMAQSMVLMAAASAGVITAGLGVLGYSKKKATKDTTNTNIE